MKKSAFFLLVLFLVLMSCDADSRNNPRIYMEGKIVSQSIDYKFYMLKVYNENRVVAETLLENGGTFKLSGPVSNSVTTLSSPEKIKTFSADKSGLSISSDSLSIIIPAEITFVKFNEIVLKK